MEEPKVGQWLYSSCAGESYGQIVAVGLDGNKASVIAIKLKDISVISWTNDEDEIFPRPDLHYVEIPKEVEVIIRDVQYRMLDWRGDYPLIECRTPGNGCYRCTKLFGLTNKEGNPYS